MSRLVLAAFLGAASGCILFVHDDPSSLGSTCQFQGSDTPCGRCVASTCASQLDACCLDSVCQTQLGYLDACVGNADSVSCDELSVFAQPLSTCMQSECAACPGANVDAGQGVGGVDAGGSGHPSCEASSQYCSCFMGGTPGGVTCTPQTVEPGLCCAQDGWPAAQTSCTCQPFSCSPSPGGATCSLSTSSTGTTSWSGGTCCSDGSSCWCDDSADSCAGATQVDSCTVAAIGCGYDSFAVTACSF